MFDVLNFEFIKEGDVEMADEGVLGEGMLTLIGAGLVVAFGGVIEGRGEDISIEVDGAIEGDSFEEARDDGIGAVFFFGDEIFFFVNKEDLFRRGGG